MAKNTRMGRRLLAVVAWMVFLSTALGVLHVLGRGALTAPPVTRPGALPAWMDQQSGPTLAFGFLRLAAMGLAWYLLATTLAGALARMTGWTRWSRAVDKLSPPVVRRLLQGAAGLTMAATVTGIQAAAWAAPGGEWTTASSVPIMHRLPPVTAPSVTTSPAATPPATVLPPPPPPPTWVVRPGDNLWSVAEATLARAWRRPPSDAEIDGYWTTLIAANRLRLAHRDDPDLVLPGQVFVLPAPPAAGQP